MIASNVDLWPNSSLTLENRVRVKIHVPRGKSIFRASFPQKSLSTPRDPQRSLTPVLVDLKFKLRLSII